MYKIDLSYIVSMEEYKDWLKKTTTYKNHRRRFKERKDS